jgi:hypothetical protein
MERDTHHRDRWVSLSVSTHGSGCRWERRRQYHRIDIWIVWFHHNQYRRHPAAKQHLILTQVPEPATAGVLALAAVGLLARRRRRS